jgi:hypothetical protein
MGRVQASCPIRRLATVVGYGQYLDVSPHRTVNKMEVEHLERNTPDIWGMNHPRLLGRGTGPLHRR